MSINHTSFLQSVCTTYTQCFKQRCTIHFDATSRTLLISQPDNSALAPTKVTYFMAKQNEMLAAKIEKNEIIVKSVTNSVTTKFNLEGWQTVIGDQEEEPSQRYCFACFIKK